MKKAFGHVQTPVGVKKAGTPAPAARSLSASVPWGQSSIATFPVKYFCSSALLFPRYDRISRSTWPDLVMTESPPGPEAPALFDTAVSECKDSTPLRCIAPMRVSTITQVRIAQAASRSEDLPAVPQRPNPALRIVDPLWMSATASSASL